ncbi:MAG: autotransporter outer membrane beta-barrel domain-containing protein [Bradyrhizobium sp.]
MDWSLRSSRAVEIGAGWWPSTTFFVAVAFVLSFSAQQARAQVLVPPPPPPPSPTPSIPASDLSSGAAITNLGSNFLERLGDQASGGVTRASRSNPGGGGASETIDGQAFRTWGEAYGISSKTGQQGNFVGDNRATSGGVAGFGARIAPGVNVGFSVDQSRTGIDVPLAMQSANLDLTQLGFNASIDKGPWTWAVALVHGFGNINSSRDTALGTASAGYNGRIDGALTELSYYWTLDQSRLVPKAALEYVHASTGSFQEVGGLDPVSASGATLERSRMLVGAEIGHYWIVDQKILDLSAYGKFVDNFEQNLSAVTVSLGPESILVQGIGESRYGADAGAALSLSLTNAVRVYLNYDGKFRSALQSHQATMGVEVKW